MLLQNPNRCTDTANPNYPTDMRGFRCYLKTFIIMAMMVQRLLIFFFSFKFFTEVLAGKKFGSLPQTLGQRLQTRGSSCTARPAEPRCCQTGGCRWSTSSGKDLSVRKCPTASDGRSCNQMDIKFPEVNETALIY